MATLATGSGRRETRALPLAKAGHFPLLDAGRGLAALAVLAHHVGNEAGFALAKHGHLAVDYFLMLSGFVVAMNYEGRLQGGMGLATFLGVRARRLYPMIVLGAVLATLAYALAPNPDIRPGWVALQFLLVPALASWVLFPLNAPMWSLFYESVANVVHGGSIAFARTRTIAVAVVVLGVIAGSFVIARGDYDVGFRPEDAGIALVRIFVAYLAGVLIWRLYAAGRLPRIALPAFVPMALVLAPLLAPAELPAAAVTLAALFVAFPASILCSLQGAERPGSPETGWAAWLGGISYPLYAVHMPILIAGKALGLAEGVLGWSLLALFSVAAAWAAERFYDAPIRAFLKARRRGRNPVRRVVPA
ncbi:acyltransferase [Sphingomonas sp. BIUV-7]|uniref:Acyltransferase n=1 Tax=Sphingomonas natans TaxID=3063330 RepID=A0ABT8Y4I1_9SPHN|nr:acyltransferase [Sphingomonas sp. BIUV-7]MDO6412902.1 acyltransferase [Sphingomonas sp. BIUV-7]